MSVAAQSTTDVFNAVWGGLAILAVLLVAAFGFIAKQINTVKTDLAAAIGEVKTDLRAEVGRVETAGERRFDKLDRTTEDIKVSVQDVSVRLTVFEAREDERARMEVAYRRANPGIVDLPPPPETYPSDDPGTTTRPERNRPAAG